MFKRFATSLSKPSQTIFFMKDSWKKVIPYIFLMPMILLLPFLISRLADPSMDILRYQNLTEIIKSDLRDQHAAITDGVLSYDTPFSAPFDYFTLYVGKVPMDPRTVGVVFEETSIVLYVSNMEIAHESYASLNLLNHDFSSTDPENLRVIDIALKTFFETQPLVFWFDLIIQYTFHLVDYMIVIILMSLMMFLFNISIQIPYKARFKLSVYLSTIWILSEFILILFHAEILAFISLLVTYIYHVIAFRSMTIIKKGVI